MVGWFVCLFVCLFVFVGYHFIEKLLSFKEVKEEVLILPVEKIDQPVNTVTILDKSTINFNVIKECSDSSGNRPDGDIVSKDIMLQSIGTINDKYFYKLKKLKK